MPKSAASKVGSAKAKPLDNIEDMDSDDDKEPSLTKKGAPGRTPASSAMKKAGAGPSKAAAAADLPEKKKMFQGESSSDEEDSDAEESGELKKGGSKVFMGCRVPISFISTP